jgi:hypothetical protein
LLIEGFIYINDSLKGLLGLWVRNIGEKKEKPR